MKKRTLHQGLAWSKGQQSLIDRELRDQADPKERGRRLTAYKARCLASTLDGETVTPLGDGFQSARLVGIPVANGPRSDCNT